MDHKTVVEEWLRNAQLHDDENYEFLRSLKFRDYGYDTDELAAELHERAFTIVDCTRCANCCKTMDIKLDDEDIERIAEHLNMPTAEFIERYLEAEEEDGPYKARQKPCPFLGDDDRCTIYDVRPTTAGKSSCSRTAPWPSNAVPTALIDEGSKTRPPKRSLSWRPNCRKRTRSCPSCWRSTSS